MWTRSIRTGQYVIVEGGFHHPWEGEIRLGSGGGTALMAGELGGAMPAAEGGEN